MLSGHDRVAAQTHAPDLADALLERYAGFAGWLRANAFCVTSADVADSMEIARRMGQFDRDLLRWNLRALLCSRAQDWRRFDELFDAYFRAPNRHDLADVRAGGAGPLARDETGSTPPDAREGTPVSLAGCGSAPDEGATADEGATQADALARADFRHLNDRPELFAIDAAIRRFARRLRGIETRREQRANEGRVIDLRWTIRRSVSRGGLPIDIGWRHKRRQRPRIVLMLDVSRSMSLYSFFLLRLARVLGEHLPDVHSFVFHTRLVRVDAALRDPDPQRAQERLHLISEGWAGGTRIGESLAAFNQRYAPRLLHARTAVVIVSDGYDAGDPALLGESLAAIRRRCHSLVWLNPLAGRPGFAPVSAGMQAALPHLDLFAGVRDLASLERVFPHILGALQ
ncbi:MAG: VWA domain-containing protein [Paraburkholderia sp.]|uniref:vWA domain-containing protein n=1 Tax=Paraburkholderia sp. TaxID=1926495 RepID=UPI001208563F|nr:VWA domain-containing protein [Paraburkholderia sp.]TAM01534.1 MAG: VWA domain-containing protein [Paraburkholderia sp.]TAM28660.1 MAG: VWA domain-containing protein [Paraburkholderia sp.]